MADRLLRGVAPDGDERVLVLCPTESSFLDLLGERGHRGPVVVADFDAARLARWATLGGRVRLATWDIRRIPAPPRGSGPQITFLDVDAAPGKEAGVFLIRAAASWTAGPLHVAGSRSLGFETILRDALLAGGIVQKDLSWRKGRGLATLGSLHQSLVAAPQPRLGRRTVAGREIILEADPFVFAGGDVDPATAMLIDAIELRGDERLLDLGCGAGIVGLALSAHLSRGIALMTDSNACAVALSRRNQLRNGTPNAAVCLAVGSAGASPGAFDVVAINPPFHSSREHDRNLGAGLIESGFAACRPGGALYVVANRFLRYERLMSSFGETSEIAGDTRFKVLRTVRSQRR
ncbi:MAG: methyltransferase [Dehalococcoidia bacterium]